MDKKITLELTSNKVSTKTFQGQKIKIKKYLEIGEIEAIVRTAIKTRIEQKLNDDTQEEMTFSTEDVAILFSTVDFIIVSECTNIDVSNLEYEDMQSSGLLGVVLNEIYNYYQAKEILVAQIQKYNITSLFTDLTLDLVGAEDNANQTIDQFSTLLENNPALAKMVLQQETIKGAKEKAKEEVVAKAKKSHLPPKGK